MRIISGSLSKREFDSPKSGKVHPMSEKVRGAIFNALGDISGLTVLDAFSGSGALALEAASRGASSVLAIEKDASVQKTVQTNINKSGLEASVSAVRANARGWAKSNNASFDLVLLDPPYDNFQPELLINLAAKTKASGLVVISLPPSSHFQLSTSNFQLLKSKNYGDASLYFYRKVG